MADWPINPVDLVVLIVMALSAILAFARGFVREVLSIGGWIGAAALSVFLLPTARPYGRQYISSELVADLVTAAVLFVAGLVIFAIVSFWLAKIVQGSALNAVDRSLGFLFGLVRGALLICLAYLLFVWVVPDPDSRPAWFYEAKSRPMVERGAEQLLQLVPEELLEDGLQRIDAARGRVEGAAEAADQLQQLNAPAAADQAGEPAAPPNYTDRARNQLDQLINGSQ